MDLPDGLGSLLPFLIFMVIVVLGNLSDRKKPTAMKKGKPFPKGMKLPDIRPSARQEEADSGIVLEKTVLMPAKLPKAESPEHRPHHPDEYEAVHSSYQQYLGKKQSQEGKYRDENFQNSEGEETKPESTRQRDNGLSIAQAILAAEILDRPKALQHRRR